jgi:hypothetical protein
VLTKAATLVLLPLVTIALNVPSHAKKLRKYEFDTKPPTYATAKAAKANPRAKSSTDDDGQRGPIDTENSGGAQYRIDNTGNPSR